MRTFEEIAEYINNHSSDIEDPHWLCFLELDEMISEELITKIQNHLFEKFKWTDFYIDEEFSSYLCKNCLNETIDYTFKRFRRQLKRHWRKEKFLKYVNHKIFKTDPYFQIFSNREKYYNQKKYYLTEYFNTEKKLQKELRQKLSYTPCMAESDGRENCSLCGELLKVSSIYDIYIEEELNAILDYGEVSQNDINYLKLLNISENDKNLIILADKIISIHKKQINK